MRITGAESTILFTGTAVTPRQVVQVTLAGGDGSPVTVRAEGPGVSTPEPDRVERPGPAGELIAEVGVQVAAPHGPGSRLPVTVIAESGGERAEFAAEITAAEPGWTMWMVSHFHYDPVWWDTQGQFTEARLLLPGEDGGLPEVRTAFELVSLHLAAARTDPDYKFVLAELDYLKPYFDTHPEDRADLRRFLAEGRIEIVGGNYNEPNTNLTSAESTIRNAIYGIGYQRDVLGGDPQAAWMLDAFGFDPGYPGIMAAAGLAESSWARGPFHQWGPLRTVGSNERMQFASEFEWVSPDGNGLLTSYMANHYGAGWGTHQAADLAGAEADALAQFRTLAPVAATRNVLLPVGADHVIPSRWVTAIHRDWNARYAWPRFVTGLPREFFAAVRADAAERGTWLVPQTRDMNPVYPGKDVSYIDTKQAQHAAETAVADGERLATLAWLAGAGYPAESLDKAWRLLAYGAHHDAITGTESDQVYLDLLAGWREAFDRGDEARREAAAALAGLADTRPPGGAGPARPVVVFNTLSWQRSGLATIRLELADPGTPWLALRDGAGEEIPFLAEGVRRHPDGSLAGLTVTFRAGQVPALGYRTYQAVPADAAAEAGWQPAGGTRIENENLVVTADPGSAVITGITDKQAGTGLLRAPGNELVLQEEYDYHPRWGEGPWLLSPKGPGTGSAGLPATVRAERCPVGARLVAEFSLAGLRVTQETLLWQGADRVEFRTHVDGSIGQDRLLRVRFPADVPGGLPIFQAATAVIGRPPGCPDADAGQHWFTLDNPAHEWFGVGAAVRVRAGGDTFAAGVAEIILPDGPLPADCQRAIRDLVAALAAQGVTATCTRPDGPRYGALDLDSNLPDWRIALGGPECNPWTARLLEAGQGPGLAAKRDGKPALLWLPAGRPRAEVFGPGADVRGAGDLPALIVTGDDLPAAVAALNADLADGVIEADAGGPSPDQPLAARCVALLNRGTPGSLVTPDGTLWMSLMRACSAWPSGVWIDGEKRTAPDGSSFSWQHWSHTFEYALAGGAGGWRKAGLVPAGQDYRHPLLACETGPQAGPLPPAASLCEVGPQDGGGPAAMLAALKPRGNPLASGLPGTPQPGDGIAVRLRDAGGPSTGLPAVARIGLFTGISAAAATSLREDDDGPALPLADGAALAEVPPGGMATVVLTPAGQPARAPGSGPASGGTAGGAAEPAQPVFTRYWLHGKGPAPAGNLPVAVHLSPGRLALAAADGDEGSAGALPSAASLRLTVACGLRPAAGTVELEVPAALVLAHRDGAAEPAGVLARGDAPLGYRYQLAADGYANWDLTVRAAPGTAPGHYFVAARIRDDLGQALEDAVLVTVGEPADPPAGLPLPELLPLIETGQRSIEAEVELSLLTREIKARPGERGEIALRLACRTGSAIRGESQLISPFGSWAGPGSGAVADGSALPGPAAIAFTAGPGEQVTLRYPVNMPADARPGSHWWALIKVMYFGRIRYTEAVPVTVVP